MLEEIRLMEMKNVICPALITTSFSLLLLFFSHLFSSTMILILFVGLKTQLVLTQIILK